MRDFKEADGLHYNLDFTRPPHLVTNGPYRLDEWTFKRRLRMVASDYYWNRASVKSKVIDQIYAEDGTAAFRTYERGDVDWLAELDSDLAAQILAHGNRTDLHIFPAFGTYFYSLNCLPKLPDGRHNPLSDVRVRQALSMSIDREPIVKNVGRLGQPISFTYIPPHVFEGYLSPPGLPYDVPKARKLLAAAGYPNGRGFPNLSILYNTESLHGDVAQIIRRQWLNNLGIQVDLEGVEVKIFGAKLYSQQYSIARASWYGDYDDPTTFTDKYKSDSDDNDSKWDSPDYDRLCAQAAKETDQHRRLVLLSKAENILLNEAPIIPLYTYVNSYMFRDQVKGLPCLASAMLMFQPIHVDR
jgi:oligopeptide transport system substrate-binding protein